MKNVRKKAALMLVSFGFSIFAIEALAVAPVLQCEKCNCDANGMCVCWNCK